MSGGLPSVAELMAAISTRMLLALTDKFERAERPGDLVIAARVRAELFRRALEGRL